MFWDYIAFINIHLAMEVAINTEDKQNITNYTANSDSIDYMTKLWGHQQVCYIL